jgi:hypothetical protein
VQLLLLKLGYTVRSRGWWGDETICKSQFSLLPGFHSKLVNIQSMSASLVDFQWMFGESFIIRSTWGFGSRPG